MPPGFAELFPIIKVPPTRNCVIKLQSALTENDVPLGPFSVGPTLSKIEPPLLPVKIAVGLYVITTFRP